MERISKTLIKTIYSLSTVKGRREESCFVVERSKIVLEMLSSQYYLQCLVATREWYESHPHINVPDEIRLLATNADMARMSSLNTPPDVMAVFRLPVYDGSPYFYKDKLYIALDRIQDPGNLGTIIRLADWFGVDTILTTYDSVDPFNPKTIMASMGSIARVKVIYCPLNHLLENLKGKGMRIWGTFMDGESIYDIPETIPPSGIIVMGNEGKGISEKIKQSLTDRISIPTFPPGHKGAESLNVAMATSIILSEFRRRSLKN